jgi:hypothetical protein
MLSALAALDLQALRSFGDAEAALAPTIVDPALRQFL